MLRFGSLLAFLVSLPGLCSDKVESNVVIRFSNDEMMSGKILKLQNDRLNCFLDMSPGKEMNLSLQRIIQLNFKPVKETKFKYRQKIYLTDGSTLNGEFVKLENDKIIFKESCLSILKLKRSNVSAIQSLNNGLFPNNSSLSSITTKKGDIIYGDISSTPKGRILISSASLEAKILSKDVESMHFVRNVKVDQLNNGNNKLSLLIELVSGSFLNAYNASIKDNKVTFDGLFENRLSVDLVKVKNIGIMSKNSKKNLKKVMLWGAFADKTDEYQKTKNILKKHLNSWQIVENFSINLDDDFSRSLQTCRNLVIAEMENYDSEKGLIFAEKFMVHASRFLKTGGNIIILGARKSDSEFYKKAGLIELHQVQNTKGLKVKFNVNAKHLGHGIGDHFMSLDATHFYDVKDKLSMAMATNEKGAAVVSRRIGNGYVIAIGMDYYESSIQTERLLINAIRLK